METTHRDIATPAQTDALRRDQGQRLRNMAEAMLQALEAIDMPKDHAGIDRMGKALITVNRVMKTIYEPDTTMEKPVPMIRDENREWVPEPFDAVAHAQALGSWLPVVNAGLKEIDRLRKEKAKLDAA